jgi:hypothetical protein
MTKAKAKIERDRGPHDPAPSPVPGPVEAKTPLPQKPSRRLLALRKPASLIGGIEDPMEMLARAAGDPTVDAAKMRELYEIVKLVKTDRAKEAFERDYIRMVPHLPKIAKDGLIEIEAKPGKRGQSTPYVKLDTIMEALWPVLGDYNFAFQWLGDVIPAAEGNPLAIMTGTLSHVDGHTKTARRQVLPEPSGSKNPEQARGSGETYAKRYLLRQLVPFVSFLADDEDDDAVATTPKPEKKAHEVISKEQAKQLHKEIKDCGVAREVFEEHFGPVENLPATALAEATARCRHFKKMRVGDSDAAA